MEYVSVLGGWPLFWEVFSSFMSHLYC